MRCPQPIERPEVPNTVVEHYPKAVIRRAKITHYCDGRYTRCIYEIGPGDYYVAPGTLSYGAGVVWCLDCVGLSRETLRNSYSARVVHLRKEKYDVCIDRSSKWGNPYSIGEDGTRNEVCEKYRVYLLGRIDLLKALEELRGLTLGCWCKPKRCHGDILVEFLENGIPWRPVPKKLIRKMRRHAS